MTLTRSEREPVDAERVTRSLELDAAPAEVWDALTEDALLGEWLADEVELEAEPGGEIVCRYADGEERRGEVELVEEAERLAWSWRREGGAPSRVELVLDAVADRTRLTIIETVPLRANGPLLLAGIAGPGPRAWTGPRPAGVAGPTGAGSNWDPPLARLRLAVRLVLA
jgi:uncharacterized protein YndB with AHSA1/START domain